MGVAGDERIRIVMLIESLDFDPGGAERLVVALATREYTTMRCTVCQASWVTETLASAAQVDRRHATLERRAVPRGGRRTRDVNRKLHRN